MTLLFYSFVTESNYDHCAHGFGTIHWSLMSSSIGALPPILSEYGAYLCFTLGAHCRHPQLLWSVTVTTVSSPGANMHSPSPYLGALPSFPAPFPPCSQSLRGSGVNVLLRAKHSIVTNLFSASWTDIHLCIHRCSLWTGLRLEVAFWLITLFLHLSAYLLISNLSYGFSKWSISRRTSTSSSNSPKRAQHLKTVTLRM